MSIISIIFDKNLPATNGIEVVMESQISEKQYAWIWDHYYSLALNKLPISNAENLITAMNSWAINMTQNLKIPRETIKEQGLLTIGMTPAYHQMTEIELDVYIEVTAQADALPSIHVRLPNDITETQLEHSPIALANFFLGEDEHFYKELVLHIISMKKYYTEQLPFTDEASISSAPEFAFNMAMQFQIQLNSKTAPI